MVQVNLLSKRKGFKKTRNVFNIAGLVVFSIIALYFLFQTVTTVYRLISVNNKLTSVKKESQAVSAEILRNNELLNRFILTKYVLAEIITLRRKQFDYSGYLDQVQSMIPLGTDLTGVDFTIPGFVNIKTSTQDSNNFKQFEDKLKAGDLANLEFNSVVVQSVLRDEVGNYRTDLLFGIKKDASNK